MNDRTTEGGTCRQFDPHPGTVLRSLSAQPILVSGDLCFLNCDAKILSYYTVGNKTVKTKYPTLKIHIH